MSLNIMKDCIHYLYLFFQNSLCPVFVATNLLVIKEFIWPHISLPLLFKRVLEVHYHENLGTLHTNAYEKGSFCSNGISKR